MRVLVISTGIFFSFFFNYTATTEIYPLSLHDALPICSWHRTPPASFMARLWRSTAESCARNRSEEHTSELQSRRHPVCRLLLEKKPEYVAQHHATVRCLTPRTERPDREPH